MKLSGYRFIEVPVTESTNDDARRLAKEGAVEKTVVIADAQNLGRGRLGRRWSSPKGGAYFSVLLRPNRELSQWPTLSLVMGTAVVRALKSFGVQASLKWPNDVMVENSKLGGISLESAGSGEGSFVIVGVGINIASSKEELALDRETRSLSDMLAGKTPNPTEVIHAILIELSNLYDHWKYQGFDKGLLNEYNSYHSLVGKEVTVRSAFGEICGMGEVLEVDKAGRLLLRDKNGELIPIMAGEVTLRNS